MAIKWMVAGENTSGLYSVDVIVKEDNQTLIDWGNQPDVVPYIKGLNMIDVYRNGVLLQQGTYQEYTETSILYLDTENPLQQGDIISIRYRPTQVNLGDLKIVGSYIELINMKNPYFNQLVFVSSTRKFYRYNGVQWEEFVIPYTTQNIGLIFSYEKIVLSEYTKTIKLSQISYPVGSGNLLVFVGGLKVDPLEYIEVDSQTIVFNSELPPGSEIEVLVANTDTWEECNEHTVEYVYDSEGNVIDEIVWAGAIKVKQTHFVYENGNIVQEIVTKNNKTIIKNYQYDTYGNVQKILVEIIQ